MSIVVISKCWCRHVSNIIEYVNFGNWLVVIRAEKLLLVSVYECSGLFNLCDILLLAIIYSVSRTEIICSLHSLELAMNHKYILFFINLPLNLFLHSSNNPLRQISFLRLTSYRAQSGCLHICVNCGITVCTHFVIDFECGFTDSRYSWYQVCRTIRFYYELQWRGG